MTSNISRPSALKAVGSATAAPPADDLDDLFDYGAGIDDVFRDVDTNMNVPPKPESRPVKRGGETGMGLGIDEEIKVAKKRQPVAKLDETR